MFKSIERLVRKQATQVAWTKTVYRAFADAKPPSDQEIAKNIQEAFKRVSDDNTKQHLTELESILTEQQKKRVKLLADAYLDLDQKELSYINLQLQDKIMKEKSIPLMKLYYDWPSLKQLEDGSWPPPNPNWFIQQEEAKKMWPEGVEGFATFLSGMFGGVSMGGAPQQAAAGAPAEGAKAEKKEEVKTEEKTVFDVELSAVDPTKKILAIKEIRALLNLGLKEAKDMAEKTPGILKKNVKKEEAEKIKAILAANGCTIKFV